jgi:RHS repeat-associated protein
MNTFKYGPAAGSGLSHETTQNARKLPWLSRDYKGSTKIVHDTYTYDANGNVLGIADGTTGSPNSRTMTYDGLDRLVTANGSWGAGTYAYDPLDNLRIADQGARTYRYNYDAASNRLSTIKNAAGTTIHTFGYDPDGNTTLKNAQHFVFDAANRMSSAEVTSGAGSQVYRYDGLGRRVQITDPDAKQNFWIYSREGQILYGLDYRRNQTIAYVYLNGSQIATSTKPVGSSTATVKFQMTDALGSPVASTSTSGGSIARTAYTPWGETTPSVDGTGFTGHVMDADTGLTYMQQRYYDPMLGRFLSIDPVAVRSSGDNFDRYWYANNNPYRFTDPDGRESPCITLNTGCGVSGQNFQDNLNAISNGLEELDKFFTSLGPYGMPEHAAVAPIIGGLQALAAEARVAQSAVRLTSIINADAKLVREAEFAGKSAQRGLDQLTAKLAAGNMNPGIGNRFLFNGIIEARGADGARVYFRNTKDGVQILAKSVKGNQNAVIKQLEKIYGN